MSGLFGNLGSNQPASSSSPFSTFSAATTTSGPSSSFLQPPASNAPTNPAAPRPLFGEITPSQPQPQTQPATTSSSTTGFGQGFGVSLGTSTSAATQPMGQATSQGGGTTINWGQRPATSAPTQSTFGQTVQQQPQQTVPTQSTFGQSQPTQQNTSQAQPSTSGSQAAYFDSLLQRSQHRRTQDDDAGRLGQLPSLQLGLSDIGRRVRELRGGVTDHGDRKSDGRARYVLAGSGVSLDEAYRNLNGLRGPAAASFQGPSVDPDTGSYVAHLQSQSTLALITESFNRSARDFDAFLERNVTMDWEAQRQRIYEHFGLAPKGVDASGADGLGDSAGGPDQSGFGHSTRRGRGPVGGNGLRDSNLSRSVFAATGMQKSVLGNLGQGMGDQAALFADTAEKLDGSNGDSLDDRFLREKEKTCAAKLQELNVARLEGRFYPVFSQFASAESSSGSDQVRPGCFELDGRDNDQSEWQTTRRLVQSYKALSEIVKEDPSAERVTDPNAVRERQFMDEYLDEGARSAKTMRMKRRILEGSRRYLEKLFMQEVEALINRFPKEARLGGVPTTVNKMRGYVTLRAARKDLVKEMGQLQRLGDQDYPWAIIYYLLRSGHVKEAVEYVTGNATAFRAIDRNFPTYITSYHQSDDRRLSRDLQSRINAEYNQRTRIAPGHTVDPYRLACYKVVGRCELNKRLLEHIQGSIEDSMWLQLALAREVNRVDEIAGEVFGLDEVRDMVRSIRQRLLGQGQQGEEQGGHGTGFLLQILSGLFEDAVAYLYPYSYLSAVHFAIALSYYGLLRVSSNPLADSDLLSYTTTQLPQISFGRMVGYYTRDFRASDVEAAADYLIMLCLHADLPGQAGKAQANLCHEALRELVLETREFAKLLGDIRSDGQRMPGAIEKRIKLIAGAQPEDNSDHEITGGFLGILTTQAAAIADDHGRTTDAVLLYHLANDYDKVISVINRALSEAIAVDLGSEPIKLQPLKPAGTSQPSSAIDQRQQPTGKNASTSLSLTSVDDPAELARNMIGLYNSNAMYYHRIRPTNRDVGGLLLRMADARRHVELGQWGEALDMIESLGLLPLQAHGQMTVIRNMAQSFNNNLIAASSSSSSSSSGPSFFSSPPRQSTSSPSQSQRQGPTPMTMGSGSDKDDARGILARTIGPLLTWSITCCAHQRQSIKSSAFADDPTRKAMADDLAAKAQDLMVFAGLIRYHLPSSVFESLARAGAEVESW